MFAFLWLLVFFSSLLNAQPIERQRLPTEIWSSIWVRASLPDSSYAFFMESATRHYTASELQPATFGFAGTYRQQMMVGMERKFTPHSSMGLSYRIANEPTNDIHFARIYALHEGKIKKVLFDKTVWFEDMRTYSERSNWQVYRLSLIASLAYPIKFGERVVIPKMTFHVFKVFQKDDGIERRRFARTRLQFELQTPLSRKETIGLRFIRQTDYFFALATYDANNQIIKPFRKLHLVLPVFEFTYLLKI